MSKTITVVAYNCNIKSQSLRSETVTFAIKLNLELKSQLKST